MSLLRKRAETIEIRPGIEMHGEGQALTLREPCRSSFRSDRWNLVCMPISTFVILINYTTFS